VAALSRQAAALRASQGVAIELSTSDEPAAPLEVKEALYRISQEALQNAVKHARAELLEVRLTRESDWLRLEVLDNGAGFDRMRLIPDTWGSSLCASGQRRSEADWRSPARRAAARAFAPMRRSRRRRKVNPIFRGLPRADKDCLSSRSSAVFVCGAAGQGRPTVNAIGLTSSAR
jgi:hypothetical protein